MFSELKGGSKKVSWTRVKEQNGWYIDKAFLLPGKTFCDPSRLAEADLHAYWAHFYRQSQAGHSFTFKATKPPKEGGNSGEEDVLGEQPEEESGPKEGGKSREESEPGENETRSEGSNEDPGHAKPAQCHSDGERFAFLRSLCPDERDYQIVVDLVAQMRVSSWHHSHIYN